MKSNHCKFIWVSKPLKNNRLLLRSVPFATPNHLLTLIAMNHTVNNFSEQLDSDCLYLSQGL